MLIAIALSAARELELVTLAQSKATAERDAAFGELVREYGPSLRAMCLGIIGNSSDADDAVQEAMCVLAAELHKFRGEARLYTWCYRIALRAAVRCRAKNRARAAVVSEAPAAAADPVVERDEVRRSLDALATLPLEQRTVLTLFVDGRSHEQISDILDVPVGTVWSRLHAARKRIRELVQR
jgi:RNA polymerase sigma-70 factor (ECF subfamily)